MDILDLSCRNAICAVFAIKQITAKNYMVVYYIFVGFLVISIPGPYFTLRQTSDDKTT